MIKFQKRQKPIQAEVSNPIQAEVSKPIQAEVSNPIQAEVSKPIQEEVSKTMQFRVVQILGEESLIINAGKRDGVKTGDVFEILSNNNIEVIDPLTNENLGSFYVPKTKVSVTTVWEKMCMCKGLRRVSPLHQTFVYSNLKVDLMEMIGYLSDNDRKIRTCDNAVLRSPNHNSVLERELVMEITSLLAKYQYPVTRADEVFRAVRQGLKQRPIVSHTADPYQLFTGEGKDYFENEEN